jgi:hypothetical protein
MVPTGLETEIDCAGETSRNLPDPPQTPSQGIGPEDGNCKVRRNAEKPSTSNAA